MNEIDARQSAFKMLRDTLSAEDGAGSDLAVFRLEEGGEWAEVRGYIDMGHLVSEVVSWAREQGTREPSEAEALRRVDAFLETVHGLNEMTVVRGVRKAIAGERADFHHEVRRG